MARTKLKLPTGAVVEKPIVTCFNVENNTYLILDAENIGSMGLPIILVCKVENGTVKKITDSAEWQKAKDYLKGIIAGNSMNYVSVSAEMSADEVYYTQLTLPVASFDVIKNAYVVSEEAVSPVIENTPVVEPVIEPAPVVPTEPIIPEVPVMPDTPVIDVAMPTNSIPSEPIIPEIPTVDSVVSENSEVSVTDEKPTNGIDFAASKEAFMKACENMFDALVAKFQAELDSKK